MVTARLARISGMLARLVAVGWVALSTPTTVARAAAAANDDLQMVPPDAAIFAHADFAALWDSSVGETFRKTKARNLEEGLKFLKEKLNVEPSMVQTITAFWPSLKQPTDFNSTGIVVKFRKPYDRAKLASWLKETAGDEKTAKYSDEEGIITFSASGLKFRIIAKQPDRIHFSLNLEEKYTKPQPEGATGPLSSAIANAKKNQFTVGINWGNFPDELRKDELPAELRPYMPLFLADSGVLTLQMNQQEATITLKASSADRPKVIEAEKSLAAGLSFLKVLSGFGIKELEKSKMKEQQALLPVLKATEEMLNIAKISVDDTSATVTSKLPLDFPYSPALEQLFGGRIGDAAARNLTMNNMKQIALALHNYHDVHGGFPPAALCDKRGKPLLSWRVLILPYIEQDALYKQFHLDEPWDSEHNRKLADVAIKIYQVAGLNDAKNKNCHFRVFHSKGALFDPIVPTKIQTITDGTSNTGMVFVTSKGIPWTKPDEEEFDEKADLKKLLWWQNDEVTPVAFGDGSVRYVRKAVDPKALKGLITKNGGEVINLDD